MAGPVILAVDEDPDALRDLDQELNERRPFLLETSVPAVPRNDRVYLRAD